MAIKKDILTYNFTPNGIKEHRGIVLHSMWGTYSGSIAWFKNPSSKASAHYMISESGEITQMVLEKDMAWHAGVIDDVAPDWVRPNPNWYTIGIEVEDKRDANWQYPEAQRKALRELVAAVRKRYDIPEERVVLHKELNPSRRSDPVGNYADAWLFDKVEESDIEQEIIADYEALTGKTPERSTIEWRLIQGLSHKDRMIDIMEGDGNFKEKWIKPAVDSALHTANEACIREKEELEQKWRSDMDSAKQKCDEEKAKLTAELKTCKEGKCEDLGWKEHAMLAIKKFPN
jgi:hypothetical protein